MVCRILTNQDKLDVTSTSGMSYRNYYDHRPYSRGRSATTTFEKPTAVTTRSYITPTYKTSSIPILRDRSASREPDPSIATIANRYATYSKKTEDKSCNNFHNRLNVSNAAPKSREHSPNSTSTKYDSSTKTPEKKLPNNPPVKCSSESSPGDRDKNVTPQKEPKPAFTPNYSTYKVYSRPSSYSRSIVKPDLNLSKYGINGSLAYSRNVETNTNSNETKDNYDPKPETKTATEIAIPQIQCVEVEDAEITNSSEENVNETETITIVTRPTSPTPPGSSAYVRNRRAEMTKTIEKKITRFKKKPIMHDKEIQSDRFEDPTRVCRFGAVRVPSTAWVSYSPPSNKYSGYAGRYSTQYMNIRDSESIRRDSKSRSPSSELTRSKSPSKEKSPCKQNCSLEKEKPPDIVTVYREGNDNESTSEIIINVNLKLKTAKTSNLFNPSDQLSQEITITNNQLPPQVPKVEGPQKAKKMKVRKSSTDSSSDSKKKVVKRRSKSDSPSESSDKDTNEKVSGLQSTPKPKKTTSNSSSQTNSKSSSPCKSKHSKPVKSQTSRESNSPETSSITNSMMSSSEDELGSRTKYSDNHSDRTDNSRTSADITVSLDKSLSKSNEVGKIEANTDDAKSFLIRALTPVTNLFKLKNQNSSDRDHWLEGSSESTSKDVTNITTESENTKLKAHSVQEHECRESHKIRPIESGERAWWLRSDNENSNKDSKSIEGQENIDKCSPAWKIRPVESGERAWWLDSNGEKIDSLSKESAKFNFYKVRHIESGEKDWWMSSESSKENCIQRDSNSTGSLNEHKSFPVSKIRHIDSGEKPWWLASNQNIPEGVEKLQRTNRDVDSDSSSDSDEVRVYLPQGKSSFPLHISDDEPLGDRRSPDGLEMPREDETCVGRRSPYEAFSAFAKATRREETVKTQLICRYGDIDDILGTSGQIFSPFVDSVIARRSGMASFADDSDECEEIDPTQVRIHDSTAQRPVIQKLRCRSEIIDCSNEDQLDDAALQVFKDGDYGPYLDLDSSLAEQEEEIEGLQDSRKNAIVMRTQLSVRVHAIIERLLKSQGRELRHALFSLKQILQSDKDLVHEFIASDGLDCLMQLGSMADQNYLDYILRALGQILLYVDGMHGVMGHRSCVRWLYSLIASKFRHVVKTSLKLLLVFVEYTEKNCSLLIDAIHTEDIASGNQPWHNLMRILKDLDASDTELLIYAMTLINRCLNSASDRNRYYDQIDCLEDQGIGEIVQLYMSKQGTDLDLLRQFQIYEAVLSYEDGDEPASALKQLDDAIIKSIRHRTEPSGIGDRRRSKRYRLTDTKDTVYTNGTTAKNDNELPLTNGKWVPLPPVREKENQAIRKRRERFARHAQLLSQQQELLFRKKEDESNIYSNMKHLNLSDVANGNQVYTTGLKNRIQNGSLGYSVNVMDAFIIPKQQQQQEISHSEKKDERYFVPRENVKDIANKLTSASHNLNGSPEDKNARVGDMAGVIMKAKEGLARSTSKEVVKSPILEVLPKLEVKTENELHWEELKNSLNRKLHLCDLDFTDLRDDDDEDLMKCLNVSSVPPPPPPMPQMNSLPSLNGLSSINGPPPPPPPFGGMPPPPPPSGNFLSYHSNSVGNSLQELSNYSGSDTIKKNKKTVKLFWREINDSNIPEPILKKIGGTIWDTLPDISVDTSYLEHLFESKSNELMIKKLNEPKKNLVLDTKRSNAINICMKKLPTPQTIKNSILKMDATVIGREGIEKLLTMLPTDEERTKIQEAQYANPDLPLGSAEQFLLTLSSISELSSRLNLWLFKLDFDNTEKEIAEPLMDLKQGIELLRHNVTFKAILSTLRSVGSFLNGSSVKGFRLEYLSKVMEVKDTVKKHPLLYHICKLILEKFPDTTDLFSEVGPIIRASKVDFSNLETNLGKLETDCKSSWDHLRNIVKHDGQLGGKIRYSEFLKDAAERIMLLQIIKNRVMNRYEKFLIYIGVPLSDIPKTQPSQFLKIVAEFALEYRTCRERVMQQMEKRATHKERNKTRGKLITNVESFQPKNAEAAADKALKELLMPERGEDSNCSSSRKKPCHRNIPASDSSAENEILESFKTVSQGRSPNGVSGRRERRSRSFKKFDSSLNRSFCGNSAPFRN